MPFFVYILLSLLVVAAMFGLNKMFSGSNHPLAKHSFKKEIGNDLRKKGYQLVEMYAYEKDDTIWKDETDINFSYRSVTVYRQIVFVDRDNNEHECIVRFDYHDILPNVATYHPPLSENDEES